MNDETTYRALPDLTWAMGFPAEHVRAAVPQLASVTAVLAGRLLEEDAVRSSDRLPEYGMSIADMERMTGKKRRWLFANSARLPFICRISRRTMEGDETLCRIWMVEQRGGSSSRKSKKGEQKSVLVPPNQAPGINDQRL